MADFVVFYAFSCFCWVIITSNNCVAVLSQNPIFVIFNGQLDKLDVIFAKHCYNFLIIVEFDHDQTPERNPNNLKLDNSEDLFDFNEKIK